MTKRGKDEEREKEPSSRAPPGSPVFRLFFWWEKIEKEEFALRQMKKLESMRDQELEYQEEISGRTVIGLFVWCCNFNERCSALQLRTDCVKIANRVGSGSLRLSACSSALCCALTVLLFPVFSGKG